MALPTTPTYTTWVEFKAWTRNTAYQSIVEDDWKRAALFAEQVVDLNITYVQPYDSDQDLKFPTIDEDGNSSYPNDLKIAHIEITTDVLLKGDQQSTQDEFSASQKSEEWSASSYKTAAGGGGGFAPDFQPHNFPIPPIAKTLLNQWNGKRLKY